MQSKKLKLLTHANFGFLTTISYLLDLAQNANKLFNQADIPTKNKLISFILHANSVLINKKLVLEVIYPYKALAEVNKKESEDSKNTNWCSIVDAFQTSSLEQYNNQQLLHLVKIFGLSADLI